MDVDCCANDEREDLASSHDSEDCSFNDFLATIEFKFHGDRIDLAVLAEGFIRKLTGTCFLLTA